MQKKTDLKGCNDRQDKGTPLKCNYSYQLQPLDLHHKCCMHSGYYEGLGQGPGVPVINWVISSKNVVITLERSGDKQGLTLSLAELLIQFARKDCFRWELMVCSLLEGASLGFPKHGQQK